MSASASRRTPPPNLRNIRRSALHGGRDAVFADDVVAFGMRNEEMASRLSISPKTVRTHIAHIFRKLGLHSRRERVGYAFRLGIV